MQSSANSLITGMPDVELAIATVYRGDELRKCPLEDILYYLLPLKGDNTRYHKSLEKFWQQVDTDFQPDIVHLHGTELAHGLAYLRGCPHRKAVVSIQGLVSVIARYYLAGMGVWDVLSTITFRDVVKRNNLWQEQRKFTKRGKIEKEIISRAHHIIGRTCWDKVHTSAIHPEAVYHFCNETLRDEFYKHAWTYEGCEKHSIFVSQAGYPIKGLHQLLKAMPLILRKYGDAKVYVGGDNPVADSSLMACVKRTGYGRYLKRLIRKLQLKDRIFFVGGLNEQQICERYLRANVFVCPSAIENSPNSLGEAQLMGVPCVASYVGGVPDMMRGNEEWMYRFEEVELLAEKIIRIFQQGGSPAQSMSSLAAERHHAAANNKQLSSIYKAILS